MTNPIIMNSLTPTPFVLDADGRSLLEHVARLLVRLQQPSLMARARNEGYTTEEHQLGWDLLTEVGGGTATVELNVASGALQLADAKVSEAALARLQQIDAFENTWFPRARAIIRRVAGEGAAELEAGFFDELEQQPLGPAVVGSVSTFLARVKSLDATPGSAGARVRATLSARGLTEQRIAAMSALVLEAKSVDVVVAPVSGPTSEQVAAASARREKALAQLDLWFNDWSTTFRSVFNVREQIKLGLTDAKGKVASKSKKKAKDAAQPAPVDGASTQPS